MPSNIRKAAVAGAALGALALGGSAIAGATDNSGSSGTPSTGAAVQGRQMDDELSGDVAAKVKAAAPEKVPGATVLRAEVGGPYSTPYHAHVRTADGAGEVVLVDDSFEATGVQADRSRRGRGWGPGGDRHGGPGERELTGATKQRVEAAVRAQYPRATIVRTETNGDSAAPYEAHIATAAGHELEVLVSRDYDVVTAREHGPRP